MCLSTDNEPSTVSLLDSCRKALKGLGIHMSVELVVLGNKEGDGTGDCSGHTKPSQPLIEQVERSIGANGEVIPVPSTLCMGYCSCKLVALSFFQ